MESASDATKRELLSRPGVTIHDHYFGGLEFRVNGREMGHMDGDMLADLLLFDARTAAAIRAPIASRLIAEIITSKPIFS